MYLKVQQWSPPYVFWRFNSEVRPMLFESSTVKSALCCLKAQHRSPPYVAWRFNTEVHPMLLEDSTQKSALCCLKAQHRSPPYVAWRLNTEVRPMLLEGSTQKSRPMLLEGSTQKSALCCSDTLCPGNGSQSRWLSWLKWSILDHAGQYCVYTHLSSCSWCDWPSWNHGFSKSVVFCDSVWIINSLFATPHHELLKCQYDPAVIFKFF